MSANDQGIVAVTGRAHNQRQHAFFKQIDPVGGGRRKITSEKIIFGPNG